MAKVSVIIPSRNERYLLDTVRSLFTKAAGEIEVIVVLGGPTTHLLPDEQPGLKFIRKPNPEGLISAINDAVGIATGKYLLKTDAHCMFGTMLQHPDGGYVIAGSASSGGAFDIFMIKTDSEGNVSE